MLAFVVYETNGLAGHYRTLINQLLSYHYGAVRAFPKAELPQVHKYVFRTQFPSLEIFINKKVGNPKKLDQLKYSFD